MTVDDAVKSAAKDRLHAEGCSCVIVNGDTTTLCHGRGVSDLYRLYTSSPETIRGAFIADKVVGKGAAALMVAGGVGEVWADVVSRPALSLFESACVPISYGQCVDNIINRSGTGICPVEALCRDCRTALECIPLIEKFIKAHKIEK
ncbi:MAG: DUF1893 domain-containing protein [Bacteroides sp.]|nr:DUF1893 domain-containing protein [Bacteroides sp.]